MKVCNAPNCTTMVEDNVQFCSCGCHGLNKAIKLLKSKGYTVNDPTESGIASRGMHWDKTLASDLRKVCSFTEDQIGLVISIVAEHRQTAYMVGYSKAVNEA